MENQDTISRPEIFKAIVADAGGYYGQLVTVASAFLGGSLFFLEKITPIPLYSQILMFLGWLFLITSIASTLYIRHWNLESGRLALEAMFDEAAKLDQRKKNLGSASIIALILGMASLAVVGILNVGRIPQNMTQNKTALSPGTMPQEERSIPYGSTRPASPQQEPAQGTQQPQNGGNDNGKK